MSAHVDAAVWAEAAAALRDSIEALKLARARWPMQPSPAQMPAYTAGQAAIARSEAVLKAMAGE